MKFLGGFQTKAGQRSASSGAIARATGGSLSAFANSYVVPYQWDVKKAVEKAYERVLWVFRSVDAIASAQAGTPIVVRGNNDVWDGPIKEYADIDRLLNKRANTYEDAWSFRYRLSSQLLLSPRGAFIEVVKSKSGGIAELHLMNPGECEPIPDPEKFVRGFRVTNARWQEEELSPEQIIWIKVKPHPTDPYRQMTPLIAAGLSIETDWLARMFNKNFLANDGRPSMIVGLRGQASNEDAAELKRRFSGGYNTAGQISVLDEIDELNFIDLGSNPRDIQWTEMLRGDKEDILMAFGVPESVLGNASGRTFDNAEAEYQVFWKLTAKDHCLSVTRPLDALTGSIIDNDVVCPDFSKVAALQIEENARRQKRSEEFAGGLATLNDYLDERGEEHIDMPAARCYFLPNGLIVAANPKDAEAAAKGPQITLQPGNPSGNEESARRGALRGIQQGQRNWENGVAARALRLAKHAAVETVETKMLELKGSEHPYMEERLQIEGFIEGALSTWTGRQEKVVVDRLGHRQARKNTRHWEDNAPDVELKAIDADYVVELNQWASDIRDGLKTILQRTARNEANRVARHLQSAGVLDAVLASGAGNPNGKTALQKLMGGGGMDVVSMIDSQLVPVLDMIEKAAANQSNRIVETIREMDADGSSLAEIKREVRRMMNTRSSWHKGLAINATTATMEGVRSTVNQNAAPFLTKKWNATIDERTRHSHAKADGQERPVNKPFRVGKSLMMNPGVTTAPIEEVAGCRCWVTYSVNEKALSNRTKQLETLNN